MDDIALEYVEEILSQEEILELQEDREQFEWETCKDRYFATLF